jgi:hypothetical protein
MQVNGVVSVWGTMGRRTGAARLVMADARNNHVHDIIPRKAISAPSELCFCGMGAGAAGTFFFHWFNWWLSLGFIAIFGATGNVGDVRAWV